MIFKQELPFTVYNISIEQTWQCDVSTLNVFIYHICVGLKGLFSKRTWIIFNFRFYTVVSDNINIMKTTFLLLTRFFRITSLQVIKEKLFEFTASLCFHIFVYPCCLKAWYKSKFNSKVVFIILILSLTTVVKICLVFLQYRYALYNLTLLIPIDGTWNHFQFFIQGSVREKWNGV